MERKDQDLGLTMCLKLHTPPDSLGNAEVHESQKQPSLNPFLALQISPSPHLPPTAPELLWNRCEGPYGERWIIRGYVKEEDIRDWLKWEKSSEPSLFYLAQILLSRATARF